MKAIVLLLVPAIAFAETTPREDCAKVGGKWTTDPTGAGCLVKGKREGSWELRATTGQLTVRREYVGGVLEGPTVSFHDTCEIAEKGTYAAGKKTGAWAMWFDNGERQAEGTYKDDVRDGWWKLYIEDAAVMEGPMVADAATGEFIERFTTGVTWRKTQLVDGLHTSADAKACAARGGNFDVNYKDRTEGCYVDEQRDGPWLTYSPEGKLESRTTYNVSVEHGEHVDYHPTGEILRRGQIQFGAPAGVHEFRAVNGQLYGTNNIVSGTGVWKAFFPDGVVSEEGEYRDGGRIGVWRTYHRKGALLDETTWLNYQRNGRYREHYPTGELKITGAFREDLRAGTWTAHFMNGKIGWSGGHDALGRQHGLWYAGNFDGSAAGFGTMANNKRDGMWSTFHDGGVLSGIGMYRMGKKHGTWFEWWPTGKFWRVVQYEMGVEDSPAARACIAAGGAWFADDKERAVGCQVCRSAKEDDKGPVNQLKTGNWTWWHTTSKIEKQGAYLLGKREGRWQLWFENGQLMLETTYADDLEEGASRGYYRDGKQRFVGAYRNGAETDEWTTFHQDGSVASVGRYALGLKVGPWKYTYPGGAVKEEGEYASGKPAGVWTSYHPRGQAATGARASQGTYVDGKRTGTWTYWRADGAPWRTETFVAGRRVSEPIAK